MKRFLLLVLFIPCAIFAQRSITSYHYGCELGYTTRNEAKAILQRKGFELISERVDTLVYSGKFRFMKYKADQCLLTFSEDTLYSITYFDEFKQNSATDHIAILKNLNDNFGEHKSLNDDVVSLMLPPKFQHFLSMAWARQDKFGKALVYSYDSLTGQSLLVVENIDWHFQYATRVVSEAVQQIMDTNPNYDKKNKVSSVAGVNFGEEETQAIIILNRKFAKKGFADKQNTVMYSDVVIGGLEWKLATFMFAYNQQTRREELIAAHLERVFPLDEYDKAKDYYEEVRATYANKYTNETCIPKEEDELLCGYGMLQADYDYNTPIMLQLVKDKSRGGEMYYYVEITYFILRFTNQVQNEI